MASTEDARPSARPRQGNGANGRLFGQAVELLARVGNHEHVLASLPLARLDLPRVEVAQVDPPAPLLRDAGGQRHLDARPLDAGGRVVGAGAPDVRAV